MENFVKKQKVVVCLCMIFLLLAAGYLFNRIDFYPRIEFELRSDRLGRDFSIFYLVKDMESFDESHRINEINMSESYKCVFFVQDRYMNKDKLRIDFGSSNGNIQISSVKIETLFLKKEIPVQFMATCHFSDDVGEVSTGEDILCIESIGDDPYIILDGLNEIKSKLYWNKENFILMCVLVIIVFFGLIKRKNENILCINKDHAIIVGAILFITYRISFLITHIGFFAYDEFFHISTLNPDYITDYDRAVYINYIVKVFCTIFGKSDLTVKLVPFSLGVVSFGCCLYLCYQLYDNPYLIIMVCTIITYMPYIVFNHFYIRMYIFLEVVIMLDCVLLYNAGRKIGTIAEKLNLLFCGIITGLYCIYTKDFSGKAILMLVLSAVIYHISGKWKKGFGDKRLLFKLGIILFCVGSLLVVFIVKLRGLKMFEIMAIGGNEYRDDNLVFLKFVFVTIFYISIPFIISIISVWKKSENTHTLYIMAALPLLGYMVVFYNAHMIRTYMSFLPIMCIMSYLVFDKRRISERWYFLIIFCVIGITINIEPDFWQVPRIPFETSYGNLGTAVSRAKDLEEQGYELVPLLPPERRHSAYFDLLDNVYLDIYADDLADAVEQMFKSDKKIVFVTDARGLGYLNLTGWRTWGEGKYVEEKYAGDCSVIILNGVSE